MATVKQSETKEVLDDPWDDSLLIKAYDDSIKLAREELARRISLSTSKVTKANSGEEGKIEHKVGDYVRATYEDGVDYEGEIISIDRKSDTCLLKYIGYENVQEVPLAELIPSWGKKVRRLQFAKAKLDANSATHGSSRSSKPRKAKQQTSMPPPPPIPPLLAASHNTEDSEHLSAMLMSWYMSGYYTGVYQGMQLAKSKSKK
uniref:Putative mrna splicing protein smn survival motor neuron n=1 Tax=Haematobia irritans TaxID=7368 RepID=A0A1L8EBH4_HAEIR